MAMGSTHYLEVIKAAYNQALECGKDSYSKHQSNEPNWR